MFEHLPELLIVLVIALIVFGPRRLPEIGASLGKGIREFRKATSELSDSVKTEAQSPFVADQSPRDSDRQT
jgi:TatA/E family protein of Tat protein translocase